MPFSVGDDFEEVEEDENLDDLQEGEVSIYKLGGEGLPVDITYTLTTGRHNMAP